MASRGRYIETETIERIFFDRNYKMNSSLAVLDSSMLGEYEVPMAHFTGSVLSRRGIVDMSGLTVASGLRSPTPAGSPTFDAATQVDLDDENDDEIVASQDSLVIDTAISTEGSFYMIDSVVTRGFLSEVYVVRDWRSQTEFALKIYRPGFEQAFWMEADVIRGIMTKAAKMPCPYIAKYYGFTCRRISDIPDSRRLHGIKMKRYSKSIRKYIDDFGTDKIRRLAALEQFGLQILEALAYLNRNFNLVHYDLKPANIMIDVPPNGNVSETKAVLIDFGSARHSVIKTNSTYCTYPYSSPEDLFGLPIDSSHDVWSLSILLAELGWPHSKRAAENASNRRVEIVQLLGKMPTHLSDKLAPANRELYEQCLRLQDLQPPCDIYLGPGCPPILRKIILSGLAYARPTPEQLLCQIKSRTWYL